MLGESVRVRVILYKFLCVCVCSHSFIPSPPRPCCCCRCCRCFIQLAASFINTGRGGEKQKEGCRTSADWRMDALFSHFSFLKWTRGFELTMLGSDRRLHFHRAQRFCFGKTQNPDPHGVPSVSSWKHVARSAERLHVYWAVIVASLINGLQPRGRYWFELLLPYTVTALQHHSNHSVEMYDTDRLSTSNQRINTCDNKQQLCSVGSRRMIFSSFACCLRGHDFTWVNEATTGFCKSSACPLTLLVDIASRRLKQSNGTVASENQVQTWLFIF